MFRSCRQSSVNKTHDFKTQYKLHMHTHTHTHTNTHTHTEQGHYKSTPSFEFSSLATVVGVAGGGGEVACMCTLDTRVAETQRSGWDFTSLFIHLGYGASNDWMMANYRNWNECERRRS